MFESFAPTDQIVYESKPEPQRHRHLQPRASNVPGRVGAVQGHLRELSKNGFLDVFRNWILRCEKCIELEGDYFEGRRYFLEKPLISYKATKTGRDISSSFFSGVRPNALQCPSMTQRPR
ncbi:hypothetical protein BV898_09260 [Hypsibius exemplaris]|uniref:Uncharacterized protein n=1 Tax=Hypsibius exemplaris TaxID=2072580 RepID=A0A1W0WMZ5_HYPEX|nr:hypothetical protein BV898_09260 [Hypsibius exemplaris]